MRGLVATLAFFVAGGAQAQLNQWDFLFMKPDQVNSEAFDSDYMATSAVPTDLPGTTDYPATTNIVTGPVDVGTQNVPMTVVIEITNAPTTAEMGTTAELPATPYVAHTMQQTATAGTTNAATTEGAETATAGTTADYDETMTDGADEYSENIVFI